MTMTQIKIERKTLLLKMTLDKRDRLARRINRAEKLKSVVEENLKRIRIELLQLQSREDK